VQEKTGGKGISLKLAAPPPTTKENAQARQTHIRSKHYIISKQGTVVPHITPTVLISTGCHKRP